MKHSYFLFPILSMTICACTGNHQEIGAAVHAQSAPPVAITEVVQTLNSSSLSTWNSIRSILERRGIQTEIESESNGVIETVWLPISDTFCGSYPRAGAPLSCKVKYRADVSTLTPIASSVRFRYIERCLEHDVERLECPGSRAERLMLALVRDLKESAGIEDR